MGKKRKNWWCAICGEKYDWEQHWPECFCGGEVCGKNRSGRAFVPLGSKWRVCVYAQHPRYGMCSELFFFLMQKEPATMPDSETFSPFFDADIRTLLFSAGVLKKSVLIGT